MVEVCRFRYFQMAILVLNSREWQVERYTRSYCRRAALDIGTYWEIATVRAGHLRSRKQKLVLLAYTSKNWGDGKGDFGSANQEAYTVVPSFLSEKFMLSLLY